MGLFSYIYNSICSVVGSYNSNNSDYDYDNNNGNNDNNSNNNSSDNVENNGK